MERLPANEFVRPVPLVDLGAGDVTIAVEAEEAERAALARRFGLVAIEALTGEASLRPNMAGEVEVSGRVCARVVQTCVVSLEPFATDLEESFVLRFSRSAADDELEVELLSGEDEPAEPIAGEHIDIGEIMAQHVALALDPYPRRPGTRLDAVLANLPPEPPGGPFAVLEALRGKLSK